MPAYEGVNRGRHYSRRVIYQLPERVFHGRNAIRLCETDSAPFHERGSDTHWIPGIVDQSAIVTAEVVEVQKAALGFDALVFAKPGEIFESDVLGEDDDEDWNLERIRTGENFEDRRVCEKFVQCRRKASPEV